MTIWEKSAFEELAMNAEIGAYQPDDDDRNYEPLVQSESNQSATLVE